MMRYDLFMSKKNKNSENDRLLQTRVDNELFMWVHQESKAQGLNAAGWLRRLIMRAHPERSKVFR